ncbi:O-antigen/teichoic acid export membrane protein [Chitinophaga skermanii]|uniref:O-antigen/teichoic acid export membrane protein n=1 Tax=Chitinophaga skermanii TaxID=331697 RepID=A0A327QH78_9BACT|nr:polysaccharide biosynthesis C-terminal domain-containing protein [Chitinophaga skermanii]RAJ03966.1 O-antigen/teichoic acid export membrane protein [Chitinophaga skermanii]
MSSIKKLTGQTLIYGVPTILGRFLNVFLTFGLTYLFNTTADFGNYSVVYAYVTFLNVIFTYGMETSYFRFSNSSDFKKDVFPTAMSSILGTTLVLSLIMIACSGWIAALWKIEDHPEYVVWFACIIGFDAIATIPFAKLRNEGKALQFSLIKFTNIIIQVFCTLYFVGLCPWLAKHHPDSIFLSVYNPNISAVGYTFISNLIASGSTLLLLSKEFKQYNFTFNKTLWRDMMAYSLPLIVVGLAGMVNEALDRTLLDHLLPYDVETNKSMIGIYAASYKIAALINIFIQIFRMGAEPFFFNESNKNNAQQVYANVMYFFTIICMAIFLGVSLFSDTIWIRYLVDSRQHPEYLQGLQVIPVLAFGYVCLGIYYNLTIWYKLTNKTLIGSYVTVMGAVITIVLNIWWIPKIGFVGSAWATMLCYLIMTIVTYIVGQRYYYVPYNVKAILLYVGFGVLIFVAYWWGAGSVKSMPIRLGLGVLGLLLYVGLVWKKEKKTFAAMLRRK